MTTVTTTTNDPYPLPFEWDDTAMPAEAPEDRLFGLLPCPMQCEQGWLPLTTGDYTNCPSCQQVE
jgi:hypothetical protein